MEKLQWDWKGAAAGHFNPYLLGGIGAAKRSNGLVCDGFL
jgi:hypothetical protein